MYAGGNFFFIGGQTRYSIAALDDSGQATAWNPGSGGTVQALAVSGDTVYAGGSFTSIGGLGRSNIAALDQSGNATAWDPSANGNDLFLEIAQALAVSGSAVHARGP